MSLFMLKDENGEVNVQAVIIIYAIPLTTLSVVTYILYSRLNEGTNSPLEEATTLAVVNNH